MSASRDGSSFGKGNRTSLRLNGSCNETEMTKIRSTSVAVPQRKNLSDANQALVTSVQRQNEESNMGTPTPDIGNDIQEDLKDKGEKEEEKEEKQQEEEKEEEEEEEEE